MVSGLIIAAVGVVLLRRAWRRRTDVHAEYHHGGHHHGHGHGHHYGDDHGHGSHHHRPEGALAIAAAPPRPMRPLGLLAMGFAGGLVPSPSAVVVLLGAVSFGRTWFGVLLVLGYGVGMAVALCGIGLALARWRDRIEKRLPARRVTTLRRIAPTVTASLIVSVALGLALRATALLPT